jgi:DNA topoisomerase-1
LTLEDALGLLRLPRHLGEHPDGGKVQAGLGRFGPYVVHDKGKGEKDYRSLKAEDDVLAIGLSRALELLAHAQAGPRRPHGPQGSGHPGGRRRADPAV